MRYKVALILVLFLAVIIRFYNLSDIPSGITYDEASHGYNAYSILKTGNDEYGKALPIFLRSFGFYASTLYTYLTIIPVFIFDLTIFSTRLVSAISGVLLVFFTYLIVVKISGGKLLGIISAFFIAISPWSVHFSRGAFEANLALTILVLGIYFCILSLNKIIWLIPATTVLAISTYAYQSERLVVLIFLPIFLLLFYEKLKKNKRIVIFSMLLFLIIQLPQFLLLSTEGASIRYKQLSYINIFMEKDYSSNVFVNYLLIYINITREFFSQYISYFSPRNLFFDPDPQGIRALPDLSVFYPWMVLPFLVGLKFFVKSVKQQQVKILLGILIISPIPAAIVTDPFSTLRVLPLLWVITIIISIGVYQGLISIKLNRVIQASVVVFILMLSFFHLYVSYFVLLKNERSKEWGYAYKQLVQKIEGFGSKQVVIQDKMGPSYIEYAFLTKFDPKKMQALVDSKVSKDYYNQVKFNDQIKLGNVEFRTFAFDELEVKDQIVVVDPGVFSQKQITQHDLKLIGQIKDKREIVIFNIFQTNPKKI